MNAGRGLSEVCGAFGCNERPVVRGIRGDEWVPGDYCAEHGRNVEPLPSPRGTALRYCSTKCFDSWEEHLDQQDKERSGEWGPVCGYDRHDHAPTCSDWLAHQQERIDKPALYRNTTSTTPEEGQ